MKLKSVLMVFVVAMSLMSGMAFTAVADHNGGNTTDNAVFVDAENASGNADTYAEVQVAVDNATEGGHVHIKPGTYNESVNLTTNDLHFVSNTTSGENVTIDGANTDSGVAFQNPNNNGYTLGDNVYLNDASASGGSGSGVNSISQEYFGIPLWVYLIVALVAVVVAVRTME